jgi:hypothetical protein
MGYGPGGDGELAVPPVEAIRISRRILWIGGDAYPLQNIARVWVSVLPLHSLAVIKQATRLTRFLLGLCLPLVVIAITAEHWWDSPIWLVTLAAFTLLAGVVIGSVGGAALVQAKRNPDYALSIETSGRPGVVLISKDRRPLEELMRRIMDTVDRPESEFRIYVNSVQYGDRITQFGDHNRGKVIRA